MADSFGKHVYSTNWSLPVESCVSARLCIVFRFLNCARDIWCPGINNSTFLKDQFFLCSLMNWKHFLYEQAQRYWGMECKMCLRFSRYNNEITMLSEVPWVYLRVTVFEVAGGRDSVYRVAINSTIFESSAMCD